MQTCSDERYSSTQNFVYDFLKSIKTAEHSQGRHLISLRYDKGLIILNRTPHIVHSLCVFNTTRRGN